MLHPVSYRPAWNEADSGYPSFLRLTAPRASRTPNLPDPASGVPRQAREQIYISIQALVDRSRFEVFLKLLVNKHRPLCANCAGIRKSFSSRSNATGRQLRFESHGSGTCKFAPRLVGRANVPLCIRRPDERARVLDERRVAALDQDEALFGGTLR